MTQRRYETPAAFRHALEDRLRREAARLGMPLQRLRQLLVFDRFWARLTQGDLAVVLKGGVALEFRLAQARATKDIDLRVAGAPERVVHQLEQALAADLGDFLHYKIAVDPHHPVLQAEGFRYGGRRYRAQAEIAGKLFASSFGVDIAFAEPMVGEPEVLEGRPWLEFIGLPPTRLLVYPVETHIAEKLHAYTLPRQSQNSRVKDLPDLALLASLRPLDGCALRTALECTFANRGTHALPAVFADPPASWEPVYARMAKLNQLQWVDLPEVTAAVRQFLGPVLDRNPGSWHPDLWRWLPS